MLVDQGHTFRYGSKGSRYPGVAHELIRTIKWWLLEPPSIFTS